MGYGTDFASQAATLFTSVSRQCGYSSCKAYFDIKSAYYTTVRQLLADCGGWTWESLEPVIQVPQAAKSRLNEILEMPSMMQKAGATAHLERMVSNALDGIWFRMPAVDEVPHTQLGTRPGCPLADLAFCLIFSQALEELHDALLRADAVSHFSWDGQ